MSTYYDKQGNPIADGNFSKLFGTNDTRIAFHSNGLVSVSTIWLILAHGTNPVDGKPYIFETLAYLPSNNELMIRYSTLEEAVSNHIALVKQYIPEDVRIEVMRANGLYPPVTSEHNSGDRFLGLDISEEDRS